MPDPTLLLAFSCITWAFFRMAGSEYPSLKRRDDSLDRLLVMPWYVWMSVSSTCNSTNTDRWFLINSTNTHKHRSLVPHQQHKHGSLVPHQQHKHGSLVPHQQHKHGLLVPHQQHKHGSLVPHQQHRSYHDEGTAEIKGPLVLQATSTAQVISWRRNYRPACLPVLCLPRHPISTELKDSVRCQQKELYQIPTQATTSSDYVVTANTHQTETPACLPVLYRNATTIRVNTANTHQTETLCYKRRKKKRKKRGGGGGGGS